MLKAIGRLAKSVVKAGVPVAGRALEEVVENAVPGGDIGLDATKIILGSVFGKKLLANLNTYLSEKYGVSLTPQFIIGCYQKDNIPSDMRTLLEKINENGSAWNGANLSISAPNSRSRPAACDTACAAAILAASEPAGSGRYENVPQAAGLPCKRRKLHQESMQNTLKLVPFGSACEI